ncbi:hypothetical protein PHYSODRAFT_304893 [Phytophthora sojae]|uniref:Uncharacterized protein n=1 Tax=Phytophthora sojae (strain P6497) TaxID=1094619 RepID=G5A0Q9_PHYSP|nr:hypothetical protein PHYSODRAFT_304893 [Phytophthora sojae]EGZ11395.1 hypothetical protein PHYSODRAFT_304893 [Phytophthora sojae]|eukprot:XP_009534140.1 hypothetical protein PHYSODRAFT_304893 [Phytophthora sojae]
MMDSTSGLDSSSAHTEAPVNAGALPFLVGSVAAPTSTTAPPNRSRPHRSRRGFAAGKSRLSLRIDADCAETSSVTAQSTPASTSSSCSSSDVVPWWEVEYQCPPPGHLGAHVVPVSADEQAEQRTGSSITTATNSSTTRSADSSELSTPTESHTTSSSSSSSLQQIRPGLVVYETPERARRGPRNKLSAIRASVPCLLVDSSPSQKRKMRSQDPTDAEADLFPTHVAKELKRFHESSSSLKKSSLPSRVVTPSTLVQPLTQIGISQTLRLKPRTLTPQATEKPHTAPQEP